MNDFGNEADIDEHMSEDYDDVTEDGEDMNRIARPPPVHQEIGRSSRLDNAEETKSESGSATIGEEKSPTRLVRDENTILSDGHDSTTGGSDPVDEKITDTTGLDASLPDYEEVNKENQDLTDKVTTETTSRRRRPY